MAAARIFNTNDMKRMYWFKAWMFMTLALLLALSSCSSTQSLQEYFVDNAENPNFLSLDVPANILKLDEVELDDSQREVLLTVELVIQRAPRVARVAGHLFERQIAVPVPRDSLCRSFEEGGTGGGAALRLSAAADFL